MAKKQTIFCLTFALGSVIHAAESRYIGSSSCASSACHGSTLILKNSDVQRNEFTVWAGHDRHSRAWKTLTTADAKRIAMHMGIKSPESDKRCLICHTTYVESAQQRGEDYREEEGVSCESCHGPSENYLKSHSEYGTQHADNLKRGMTDLSDLNFRAGICLDCHQGNSKNIIDHSFFGAGHPRLTFELDTFQSIMPTHWKVDDDYKKRKQTYSPTRGWLVGQVLRAERSLQKMLSPEGRVDKDWISSPELSLLYCSSCHHSVGKKEFRSRTYARAGVLRPDVSSLQILSAGLTALDSKLADSIQERLKNFSESEARSLLKILSDAREKIIRAPFSDTNLRRIISAILQFPDDPSPSYEMAEQVAMAASSILSELYTSKNPHEKKINKMYKNLEDPSTYSPVEFMASCKDLATHFK